METIDRPDVQGIIVNGYARLRAARFVLLRVTDPAAARGWLRALAPRLTTASDDPQARAINVAVTVDGLRALGLDDATLREFGAEFFERMHYYVRAGNIGDVGASSSANWRWGGPGKLVDITLLLYGRDEQTLAAVHAEEQAGYTGVEEHLRPLDTRDLGTREHFGFADALSQPVLENTEAAAFTFGALKRGPDRHTIKPGEILLGYQNESGRAQKSPSVPAGRDLGNLPRRPDGRGDLGRNGSYMVLRQLEQDVPGFWKFIADRAPADRRTALAAKLVGRWPSGAPLVAAPDADDPTRGKLNDFGFQADDADGLRCPFGAHIRRANPRDWLVGTDAASALAESKQHRLLRRGRPYGRPLRADWDFDAMAAGAADGEERGLHFLCFNADIRTQFEFVHWRWLNARNFAGLASDADPLVGAEPDRFTIQGAPPPLTGMSRFITVRGGAYFFMPGVRAVDYLGRSA